MSFKELTTEEINALSSEERRQYLNELKLHTQQEQLNVWKIKSWEEKKHEIFSGYNFFIGRRGLEDMNLEEQIEVALSKSPNSHSFYAKTKGLIDLYNKTILKDEEYTYFWATKSPFSQWHKSSFTATTLMIEGIGFGDELYKLKRTELLNGLFPFDNQEYSSAEQFMMYHKAMIFLDREIASQIMSTHDVKKIKGLGREIKEYDEDIWKYFRSKVVYEGNKAKFTQSESLKEALFATKGTTLVEAAPNDTIWGIGLTEDDPRAKKRETWQGKNLLGEILTQLRVDLMGEY